MSRTIESLVKLKYVTRHIPENNRRITIIKLTDEGGEVCKTINTGNDSYFKKALQAIPSDQLSIFLNSFELLVNKMINLNHEQKACE